MSGVPKRNKSVSVDASSANIWERNGNAYTFKGYLTASNHQAGDQLGFSVAISEDESRVVAGAPFHLTSQGRVYVFDKPVGGWIDAHKIQDLEIQTDQMEIILGFLSIYPEQR